ncbi:MAG: TerB family tellurite resistance protein [Rhodothermales bacterium]|nr:TerB family tellurite resistance protein [Rhodothermales bacterium]
MLDPRESWSRVHDLALVYLALAYGTDSQLSASEMDTIVQLLHGWRSDLELDDVRELAMESLAIFLDPDASDEVVVAIDRLHDSLEPDERRRALEDVVRIARADGVLLGRERTFISHLAGAWGLKAQASDALQQASDEEEDEDWTLLHDLGLVYIVLAHSTDSQLSDAEIAAMLERMSQWQPDLAEAEIRDILRDSLAAYAKGPGEEELTRSVSALKNKLPFLQRLAVLDDLTYIAEADGSFNEFEREMITSLSKAFNVAVRVDD